jgi:hypothetical protein
LCKGAKPSSPRISPRACNRLLQNYGTASGLNAYANADRRRYGGAACGDTGQNAAPRGTTGIVPVEP